MFKKNSGFTLIELLIVVAIIGILAAVGAAVIPNLLTNAKINCTTKQHKQIWDNFRTRIVQCSAGGKISYGPTEEEKKSLKFRRSIYIIKDMKKGEKFSNKNIQVIRPNQGLHPKYFNEVMGKKIKKNVKYGTPLKSEHFK